MNGEKHGDKPTTTDKKFAALAPEFKDAISQSDREQIKARISKVAILDVEERQILKEDGDVLSKKEELSNLMEPYRENLKQYKLQIEYMKLAIDEKGGSPK